MFRFRFNSLSPNSDQQQFSPNNILTLSTLRAEATFLRYELAKM